MSGVNWGNQLPPQYGHGATHPMSAAVSIFIDELRGLKEMVPMLAETASAAEDDARRARKSAVRDLDVHLPAEDMIGGVPSRRRLDVTLQTQILYPSTRARGLLHAQRDLGSAVLLMMGAHFDRFVGETVRASFEIQPALRKSLRRKISSEDLAELQDIGAVHALMVEKELDDILHRDRQGQLQWFESRCGVAEFDRDLVSELGDTAEIRNLVAHHGGVVTTRVAILASSRGKGLLRGFQEGNELDLTQERIETVHDIFVSAAIAISQGAWRNLRPDERSDADQLFHELTYTQLALAEFSLAKRLLHLGDHFRKTMAEWCQLVNAVNLAQSYKWLNDDEACLDILRQYEWEKHESSYQLAVAALREQWDLAEALMGRCIAEDNVTRAEFENWPVFSQFRQTAHFKRAFERSFG